MFGRHKPIALQRMRRHPLSSARAGPLFCAFIAAFVLFIQTVELTHSHNGLLERSIDCQICVRLGSSGGAALPAEAHSVAIASLGQKTILPARVVAVPLSRFSPEHPCRAPPIS